MWASQITRVAHACPARHHCPSRGLPELLFPGLSERSKPRDSSAGFLSSLWAGFRALADCFRCSGFAARRPVPCLAIQPKRALVLNDGSSAFLAQLVRPRSLAYQSLPVPTRRLLFSPPARILSTSAASLNTTALAIALLAAPSTHQPFHLGALCAPFPSSTRTVFQLSTGPPGHICVTLPAH